MKRILIGPAGWHYPDWKGVVYPARTAAGFSELAFLAEYFSAVEINTSFYRIPSLAAVENWLAQVRKHPTFQFAIKLWQGFTHEERKDLAAEVTAFSVLLNALAAGDRLGALLVQFPWRFKYTAGNLDCVERLHEWFSAFPVSVEFRHSSWADEGVYEKFQTLGLGWVNVDQPVIGASQSPAAVCTSANGYVRLHGRNYEQWFEENSGRNARYDYLYKAAELSEWVERIKTIAAKADNVFVIFNNHFRGQAVANGLQMAAAFQSEPVSIPASLARLYPHLADIGRCEADGETLSLF